jgi:hypothetical protein
MLLRLLALGQTLRGPSNHSTYVIQMFRQALIVSVLKIRQAVRDDQFGVHFAC